MTDKDKQANYEAALTRLNDRLPAKSDSTSTVDHTQRLLNALADADLQLVIGKVWLISHTGASRIDLADILPESLKSFAIRVEVGAAAKEPNGNV